MHVVGCKITVSDTSSSKQEVKEKIYSDLFSDSLKKVFLRWLTDLKNSMEFSCELNISNN